MATNVARGRRRKPPFLEAPNQLAEPEPVEGTSPVGLPASDLPLRLWTVREVAEFLGVHQKTVYRWVAVKGLVSIRLGNRVRFDPRDVLRWVSARREV